MAGMKRDLSRALQPLTMIVTESTVTETWDSAFTDADGQPLWTEKMDRKVRIVSHRPMLVTMREEL